jgi:hypothetical protein
MSSEHEQLIKSIECNNIDVKKYTYLDVLSDYLQLCTKYTSIEVIKSESKISSRQYPNRNLMMSLPIQEIVLRIYNQTYTGDSINSTNYPHIDWKKSIRENIELKNPGYSVYSYYYNIDYNTCGYCVKLCKNDGFINNIINHPWLQSIWGGYSDEF